MHFTLQQNFLCIPLRYHYQTLSVGIIWDSLGTDKKENMHFSVHVVCVSLSKRQKRQKEKERERKRKKEKERERKRKKEKERERKRKKEKESQRKKKFKKVK
jgi:hypothetical protein